MAKEKAAESMDGCWKHLGDFGEPGEGATTVYKTRNLARSLSTFDQKVIRVTIIPENPMPKPNTEEVYGVTKRIAHDYSSVPNIREFAASNAFVRGPVGPFGCLPPETDS